MENAGRLITRRLVHSNLTLLRFYLRASAAVAQGGGCMARWSIVSENKFMIEWSKKLQLQGPKRFQRFQANPSDTPSESAFFFCRAFFPLRRDCACE